jgi:hypothetical protein
VEHHSMSDRHTPDRQPDQVNNQNLSSKGCHNSRID